MTASKFNKDELQIRQIFPDLHAVQDEPTSVDDLLGQPEPGKLRRLRNDQLTKFIALVLPLKFNQLTQRIENEGEQIDGDFLGTLYIQLAEQFQVEINKVRAQDAAMLHSRRNGYHPVRDYLAGINTTLEPEQWESIAQHVFGLDDPIASLHLRRQLIGLIARAMKPRCKLDTALVIHSPQQGIGKSTMWSILGGPWFSDSLDDLRNLKDDVRKPYGRGVETLVRSCGIVGTTNRSDFIKDPTGNRRFPVISVDRVDTDWVQQHRDRIWGSALAAFNAGTPWHYDKAENAAITKAAQSYAAEDPLRDRIETWIEEHPDIHHCPVARIIFDINRDKLGDQEFSRQVSLRLTAFGWCKTKKRERAFYPDSTKHDKATMWTAPSTAPAD